jgi:putative ubiquitin-RnfH superfamily antitoxin RatB of RatAB toxin-antitoxin module
MACAETGAVEVEVVFCPEQGPVDLSRLRMPGGATLAQAVAASGVVQRHPVLAQGGGAGHGIWGRLASAQQVLHDGDRVELYRPLRLEPKDARRERQRVQRRERQGNLAR